MSVCLFCAFLLLILTPSLPHPHPLTPPPSPHRSGLYTTVEDDLSSRLRHSFVDPYYMQQAASELGPLPHGGGGEGRGGGRGGSGLEGGERGVFWSGVCCALALC